MPENNEPQYELDENYEPLGIVDAADGSGTTWSEFVEQVNKMDNQVAALTEDRDSRSQQAALIGETTSTSYVTVATLEELEDFRSFILATKWSSYIVNSVAFPGIAIMDGLLVQASENVAGVGVVWGEVKFSDGLVKMRVNGSVKASLYGIN